MKRRRRSSEMPFGSDSFLDILANLVGIVLIIIVLVGARIRHLPEEETNLDAPKTEDRPAARLRADLTDIQPDLSAEEEELIGLRAELLRLVENLSRHIVALEAAKHEEKQLIGELRLQEELGRRLQQETATLVSRQEKLRQRVASTESDKQGLRKRLDALNHQIRELQPPPAERRPLRYFLPVSKPLGAGELLFECRANRIAFIDLQSLLNQVRQRLSELAKQLTERWETSGETEAIGPFKLRFKVVRERFGPVDQAFAGLPPANNRAFSYAVDEWEIVPVWPVRGETLEEALADGSRFRSVIDNTDPDLAALTMFVYEDSFSTFRQLREYLHERGFVVAGRPLRLDAPIAGSRRGSISRGQ